MHVWHVWRCSAGQCGCAAGHGHAVSVRLRRRMGLVILHLWYAYMEWRIYRITTWSMRVRTITCVCHVVIVWWCSLQVGWECCGQSSGWLWSPTNPSQPGSSPRRRNSTSSTRCRGRRNRERDRWACGLHVGLHQQCTYTLLYFSIYIISQYGVVIQSPI